MTGIVTLRWHRSFDRHLSLALKVDDRSELLRVGLNENIARRTIDGSTRSPRLYFVQQKPKTSLVCFEFVGIRTVQQRAAR